MITLIVKILILAYVQNISFSIVSRSRNRNNMNYHIIAAIFSNSIWFLTFRELIVSEMNFILFIPYVLGTVLGSVTGVRVSIWIEKILNASGEDHLRK